VESSPPAFSTTSISGRSEPDVEEPEQDHSCERRQLRERKKGGKGCHRNSTNSHVPARPFCLLNLRFFLYLETPRLLVRRFAQTVIPITATRRTCAPKEWGEGGKNGSLRRPPDPLHPLPLPRSHDFESMRAARARLPTCVQRGGGRTIVTRRRERAKGKEGEKRKEGKKIVWLRGEHVPVIARLAERLKRRSADSRIATIISTSCTHTSRHIAYIRRGGDQGRR